MNKKILLLILLLLCYSSSFSAKIFSNALRPVAVQNPTDKQPLVYDGTLNAWTNGDEIALTAVQVDSVNVTNLVADSIFSRIHVTDTVRVLTSADVTGSSNVDGEATFNDIVTLENDTWLRAKNAAGTGYVNMFRVGGTDIINLGTDVTSDYSITSKWAEATSSVTRYGMYAFFGGTGSYIAAYGYRAGRENTHNYLSAFGAGAGDRQKGQANTFIGNSSGYLSRLSFSSACGYFGGREAIGKNNTFSGVSSGWKSVGNYSVSVGFNARLSQNGSFQTALGARSFISFDDDLSTIKTFDATDILSTSTDYIKIVSHNFGATGEYVNLRYTEGTSSIGGLSDGSIIQFEIISDSVIYCRSLNITSAGTGTGHTLNARFIYNNSAAVGYNAEPDAGNQVMLGDTYVTQVKTHGKFTAMDSIPTDNKDLASKFYVDKYCPTFYGAQMTAVNNITQTEVEADAYILLNVFDQDVSATNGWEYHGGSSGIGTAFSDYSGTVSGATLVTSAGHGLDDNCVISIYNTANYNGIYQITTVGTDAFYIIKTFVADDGASDWDCADYFELTDPAAEGMYRVVGTLSFRVDVPASVTLECFSFINEQAIFGIKRFFPNNDLSTMTGGGLQRFELGDRWGIGIRHNGSSNVLVTDAIISIQKVGK